MRSRRCENAHQAQGESDKKLITRLSAEALRKVAGITPKTKTDLETFIDRLLAVPPYSLGYLSETAQSGCYPGDDPITQDEVDMVSDVMSARSIGLENTRIRKVNKEGGSMFQLLQASAQSNQKGLADGILLVRGDYSGEKGKICIVLEHAKEFASNSKQANFLEHFTESCRTGSLHVFQESQKVWVPDVAARVETIIGFIEPYRDRRHSLRVGGHDRNR
jgi:dipeptidyl-peptidase-3